MGEKMSEQPAVESSPIRIKWEVPLPWLIGGLAVICVQAAVVYSSNVRQGEMLVEQAITQKELLKQVRDLGALISNVNVKDVEHDMKLADHERRLQVSEFRNMGLIPRPQK